MSVASDTDWDDSAIPRYPAHRFTVQQYHQLGKAGVLKEEDHVELLEGWIVPKVIRSAIHDGTVVLVDGEVRPRLASGWHVRIQSAITTADSEPEPDLAIVRGSKRDFLERLPGPDDIALVIEVADSSVRRDRLKATIYAQAGIAIYWIVNIAQSTVEVYTEPYREDSRHSYRRRTDFRDDDVVPFILDGTEYGAIPAKELLP